MKHDRLGHSLTIVPGNRWSMALGEAYNVLEIFVPATIYDIETLEKLEALIEELSEWRKYFDSY